MSRAYDVIIIGGGIMGCSTALQLSKAGYKVAVFEKGSIGQGPTGKSSAIIRQHYSNELTARMALYSLQVFQDFEERIGGECGFNKAGFLALVEAKDRTGLETNLELQRKVGIRTELLSGADILDIMPALKADDLVAVAYEPDSGYADPYLTVTSFAQAARRHGADFFQDTEIVEIQFQSDRVTGVRIPNDSFGAAVVVNCAGAWGARVARLAGVELPINSCRVQVAFFRRPSGHETPHPVIADFINATYFRSETGGLTLVGLIDPSEADAIVNPDNFPEYMDGQFLLEAGDRLVRRYPAMELSESTGGYASLYAITPDWHPILDEVPSGSGFYICSGFSGHGFKLGPAIGLMMAEMIAGKSQPIFDPTMFRASRFAEGQPVRGKYEYSIVG